MTGAAGFVGSHLCERLIGDGFRIVGIDCFTDYYPRCDKEANLAGLWVSPNFDFVEVGPAYARSKLDYGARERLLCLSRGWTGRRALELGGGLSGLCQPQYSCDTGPPRSVSGGEHEAPLLRPRQSTATISATVELLGRIIGSRPRVVYKPRGWRSPSRCCRYYARPARARLSAACSPGRRLAAPGRMAAGSVCRSNFGVPSPNRRANYCLNLC